MDSKQPLVVEKANILTFIQLVLDQHTAPSLLVVCTTKDAFVEELHAATLQSTSEEQQTCDDGNDDHAEEAANRPANVVQPWTVPSLRLLSTSRTVKVAFCPDITHLRGYLATYHLRLSNQGQDQVANQAHAQAETAGSILAILNPIQLHRPTSAFSAQGINRTLSIAVEAAHHTGSRLVMAECPSELPQPATEPDHVDLDEAQPERVAMESPWDEEVSMLNVTTKGFNAGERGWVGRTVETRTIAERWCSFSTLEDVGAA